MQPWLWDVVIMIWQIAWLFVALLFGMHCLFTLLCWWSTHFWFVILFQYQLLLNSAVCLFCVISRISYCAKLIFPHFFMCCYFVRWSQPKVCGCTVSPERPTLVYTHNLANICWIFIPFGYRRLAITRVNNITNYFHYH